MLIHAADRIIVLYKVSAYHALRAVSHRFSLSRFKHWLLFLSIMLLGSPSQMCPSCTTLLACLPSNHSTLWMAEPASVNQAIER